MKALLFRQASEQYKTLEVRDEDIKAEEMREALAGREEIGEFDEELYRKLIKKIVVHKDDSVRVIFSNNNSIKIGYRDLSEPERSRYATDSDKEESIHDTC